MNWHCISILTTNMAARARLEMLTCDWSPQNWSLNAAHVRLLHDAEGLRHTESCVLYVVPSQGPSWVPICLTRY